MILTEPKDKQEIVKTLLRGRQDSFWNLIEQSLDNSAEVIKREMENPEMIHLPAEEYKALNELYKAKIAFLLQLKNLPDTIIRDLTNTPDQSVPGFVEEGVY